MAVPFPRALRAHMGLRQVMDPAPSQLAAAVMALLNTLIARSKDSTGVVWLFYQLSYSHWALEAYVIAEANRLTGAPLLFLIVPESPSPSENFRKFRVKASYTMHREALQLSGLRFARRRLVACAVCRPARAWIRRDRLLVLPRHALCHWRWLPNRSLRLHAVPPLNRIQQ